MGIVGEFFYVLFSLFAYLAMVIGFDRWHKKNQKREKRKKK